MKDVRSLSVSSHSAESFLPIPEDTPRIKIGNQYYRIVRIVGGHYEKGVISNLSEIEKATRIGEVLFSAHQQHIGEKSPNEYAIKYIDDQGVHYENGEVVNHESVHLNPEHAISYFQASDHLSWQQSVIDFEVELKKRPAHTTFTQASLPLFLQGLTKGAGPFAISQVKKLLINYTQERLVAAYKIYAAPYPTYQQQENQKATDIKTIDQLIKACKESATDVINECNKLFKSNPLRADNLWKMMVRSLQPETFRLLPEEESLMSENKPSLSLSLLAPQPPLTAPITLKQSSELSKEASALEKTPAFHSVEGPNSPPPLPLTQQFSPALPSSPTSSVSMPSLLSLKPFDKIEFYEQEDFKKRAALYPCLKIAALKVPEYKWISRDETKNVCEEAHKKLEKNAPISEYTPSELDAIKSVIKMKKKAGGFEILMDGSRYQSVSTSLAHLAKTGLLL